MRAFGGRELSAVGDMNVEELDDGAWYCKLCGMWLNGPDQAEDHLGGNKHRTRKTNSNI